MGCRIAGTVKRVHNMWFFLVSLCLGLQAGDLKAFMPDNTALVVSLSPETLVDTPAFLAVREKIALVTGDLDRAIAQIEKKYGKIVKNVLRRLLESVKGCGLRELENTLDKTPELPSILSDLERMKVIVTSYVGRNLQEWKLLEETRPIIRAE